jgi:hypothetical protein
MFTRIRQWFIRLPSHGKQASVSRRGSQRYVKLPKDIWELDDSYKAMLKELSKR